MMTHVYTFGYEEDNSDVVNLFIARYNGEVRFNSFEDYKNGIWSRLRFMSLTQDIQQPEVWLLISSRKKTLYIQDKWYVNSDLTVQFGLRYDSVLTPVAPATNVNFVKEYGFSNASKFDFDLLQPRFSFNMDVSESLFGDVNEVVAATLRGGRGLFIGGTPRVW